MNNGYIRDVIEKDHYLGGTLPTKVLQKDRDWRKFLPEEEIQRKFGIETSNCTGFHTLNPYEILLKRKFGITFNASDRYTGIRAHTTPNGNSPHKVAESLRKFAGLVPEATLTFNDSIKSAEDYYTGALFGHKIMGARWLLKWEPKHEWVLDDTDNWSEVTYDKNWQEKMYDALQYSPLGVAVDAWHKKGTRYVRNSENDNHWCTLVYASKNNYWLIFDSYGEFLKKLDWDYGFTRVKRYDIDKRKTVPLSLYTDIAMGFIT